MWKLSEMLASHSIYIIVIAKNDIILFCKFNRLFNYKLNIVT